MAAINDLAAFAKNIKAEKAEAVGSTTLTWLSPEVIEEEPGFNLRDYERPETKAHIAKLAAAWASGAQMPPLEVKIKDGRCYVRDGHCRLRGARMAIANGSPIKRVSVIELKGADDVAHVRLLTSNDSLKLTPIQRAHGYQRLRNYGWDDKEIAKELGVTETTIREAIRLLTLPDEIQAFVADGVIKAYFAVDLWREHGSETVAIIQEAVEREQLLLSKGKGAGSKKAGAEAAGGAEAQQATEPPPPAQVTISRKNIRPRARPVSRDFMSNVRTHFGELRAALEKSAVPDAKSATVAVKLPIDLYENFMKFASQVQVEDAANEPEKNDAQQQLPALG
ncbi:ParB/RepB/Spo0J family partition protein [Pseudomonas aeruginosa]|nr:hypothetical protein [Pseudomonas aeruginosa]EKX2970356.1 hypothetical protein [Pseudomonas aeruginosa]